jgi:hypothetical protein
MAYNSKLVADIKVGKVRGNSRVYPQFRLPSQYAELAGRKASIYELNGPDGDTSFLISFDDPGSVAACHERAERAGASFACDEPCRGSDSGSNPDSGASFNRSVAPKTNRDLEVVRRSANHFT